MATLGTDSLTMVTDAPSDGGSYGRLNAGWAKTLPLADSTTVAALPTLPADGQRGFVSDATLATFGSTVVGGGTNHVPVYYDAGAAAWKIG
jgi:hypothetical protein